MSTALSQSTKVESDGMESIPAERRTAATASVARGRVSVVLVVEGQGDVNEAGGK